MELMPKLMVGLFLLVLSSLLLSSTLGLYFSVAPSMFALGLSATSEYQRGKVRAECQDCLCVDGPDGGTFCELDLLAPFDLPSGADPRQCLCCAGHFGDTSAYPARRC